MSEPHVIVVSDPIQIHGILAPEKPAEVAAPAQDAAAPAGRDAYFAQEKEHAANAQDEKQASAEAAAFLLYYEMAGCRREETVREKQREEEKDEDNSDEPEED